MRGISQSMKIAVPPGGVWNWLQQLSSFDALADAFANKNSYYHHVARNDPSLESFPAGSSPVGARLSLQNPRGKEAMVWEVVRWDEPKRIAMIMQQHGRLVGHQAQLTIELIPLTSGETQVEIGLFLIMHNLFIELFSLACPRFLYGWALKRMLRTLRASID